MMHDAILPGLAQPSLMIDFLTRAYDAGGWGPRVGGEYWGNTHHSRATGFTHTHTQSLGSYSHP